MLRSLYLYLLIFVMVISMPCHAAPKKKSKRKKTKNYKKRTKRRKKKRKKSKKKKKEEKDTKKDNDQIEDSSKKDENKEIDENEKKKNEKEDKAKEEEDLKEIAEIKEEKPQPETKEKEDPKKAYSYTWKSEKKKIFEKKEPLVYGNKTTKFITFEEIKDNIEVEYRNVEDLDVRYIHHWTLNEKYGYILQDLGVDGTPSRNIYFTMPEYIGTSSGYSNFDLYYKHHNRIKIYDTKSPYSFIYVIPGKKISKIVFEYSQNIKENWNIGGTFSNLSMASPFELYPKTKYALSRMFDVHSHYKSADNKYDMIITLSGMKHYCKEFYPVSDNKEELLSFDEEEKLKFRQVLFPNLNLEYPKNGKPKFLDERSYKSNGKNKNSKIYINIYNQYEIFNERQIYYQLGLFYDNNSLGERDGDELEDDHPKLVPFRSTTIKGFENEGGYKGIFGENIFYRIYARRTDLFRSYDHLELDKKEKQKKHLGEHYIGGKGRYKLNETSNLGIEIEYLLLKHYRTAFIYKDEALELSFKHSRKKDPFICDYYNVYHMSGQASSEKELINPENKQNKIEFPFPFATKVSGAYKVYESENILLIPKISALSIGKKLNECNVYAYGGGQVNLSLGNFHLDNNVIGSIPIVKDYSSYAMPTLFINTSLYYLTSFYRDKLKLCTGFDINFKTKYEACIYSRMYTGKSLYTFNPEIKNTDKFSGGYPVANFFLNLVYDNLALIFKISHINQGLFGPGYFATNPYPGQSRSFDLAIAWKFFN